jgi:hypothetical protein
MKNKLLIITLLLSVEVSAQLRGSIEQIYYFTHEGNFSMGPIAQIQNASNWHAEVRYNYEEKRTFSFYVGRVYEREEATFSYSIIPIFGGVVGRFKGGSGGLHIDMAYKNFYFLSQSQYTFSVKEETESFCFTWSELGYELSPWLHAGAAAQLTYYPQTGEKILHPGLVVGFSYKRWTLPLYVFNPLKNDMNFVCSIIWEWGQH